MILTILLISMASNIFVSQIDPFEYIKEKMGLGPIRKLKSGLRFLDLIFYSIHKLLNCVGCVSYWATVGLYLYWGSYDGFIIGLLSYGVSTWIYNNIFTTKINF